MGIGLSTPVPVLMLGLDGSGKTTLLYRVKLGRAVDTIPTISFNYETLDQQSSVPTRIQVPGILFRKFTETLWSS